MNAAVKQQSKFRNRSGTKCIPSCIVLSDYIQFVVVTLYFPNQSITRQVDFAIVNNADLHHYLKTSTQQQNHRGHRPIQDGAHQQESPHQTHPPIVSCVW